MGSRCSSLFFEHASSYVALPTTRRQILELQEFCGMSIRDFSRRPLRCGRGQGNTRNTRIHTHTLLCLSSKTIEGGKVSGEKKTTHKCTHTCNKFRLGSETPLIILRRTTGYKFGSERERERDNIVFFLLPRKSIVAADLRIHRRHF